MFPLKHRTAIAKILGLSKNVRQIYELLSLSKSRGYGQKVRGIAKKKQSLSLAVANSSLLPLQYSALAQRSQVNAEISGLLTKLSV